MWGVGVECFIRDTNVYVFERGLRRFIMHHRLPLATVPYDAAGCACLYFPFSSGRVLMAQ